MSKYPPSAGSGDRERSPTLRPSQRGGEVVSKVPPSARSRYPCAARHRGAKRHAWAPSGWPCAARDRERSPTLRHSCTAGRIVSEVPPSAHVRRRHIVSKVPPSAERAATRYAAKSQSGLTATASLVSATCHRQRPLTRRQLNDPATPPATAGCGVPAAIVCPASPPLGRRFHRSSTRCMCSRC